MKRVKLTHEVMDKARSPPMHRHARNLTRDEAGIVLWTDIHVCRCAEPRSRQTDRAGRMLQLYGALTVNDLHEAFMRVDTAAMFAPEESGTSEAELV